VIPNSKILDTEIINYGKMKHRRKRFKIGLVYETLSANIKRVPEIIENVISKIEFVKYERCYLVELNSYSIDYMISYDISETDYLMSL
jgi:small-conductance mechanosensitive channel